ncbi:MAG: hypothetical protein IKH53_02330 [Muribaculaceae bacterium]|nr:hypothetical protein [Muribaculaceae bacterium]
MKRITTLVLSLTTVGLSALAGGLLHNTNQHIAFMRMMARGASHEIDAVYTNPAGLAFMDHDGWTLSLNIQSASQRRDVLTTFALFPEADHTRLYKGKAEAPVLPSLYGAYKKDRWTFSGFFGITGGGGKCDFDSGLPMFDAAVMAGVAAQTKPLITRFPQADDLFPQHYVDPSFYDIESAMKGRQYIFGLQLGGTYKILDWMSAYAGFRMNYFNGNYSGHISASANDKLKGAVGQMLPLVQQYAPEYVPVLSGMAGEGGLAKVALDCSQTGWGVTPIIGVDLVWKGFTLAAKYEFKTNLNIENDNKTFENDVPDAFKEKMADYKHGVNTPSDLPAVFYAALGYEFIPHKLRATVEYHYYDDKHAEMAHGKQKALRHGTHEVLAGVEWDINKMFTVSAGAQNTDYGLSDQFQTHTSFSCDSYSIGFGGAVNLSEKVKLNVGYFWTTYKDYDRSETDYFGTTLPGKDTYSRTNKVFGAGIDFKF